MAPYFIVMAGGSASGKSSIVQYLKDQYPNDITVLYFDDYYKELSHLSYEERAKVNFDHPDAFDLDLLIEHLRDLKQGKSILKPIYDFTTHNRKLDWETLKDLKLVCRDFYLTIAKNIQTLDRPKAYSMTIGYDGSKISSVLYRLMLTGNVGGRGSLKHVSSFSTFINK